MRTLPILALLMLGGCSIADLKGIRETNLAEIKGNDRIMRAEQECAGDGLVIGTKEYDQCLDDNLKDEPAAKAQLDRLKAEFARRLADGTLHADNQCERFGYYRGTAEYNICMEYARENNMVTPTKTSVAPIASNISGWQAQPAVNITPAK